MTTIALKTCTVEFTAWGAVTTFPDGTKVPATPHYEDHHYFVISHRCGYGDDVLRYAQEHEVCHALIGEFLQDGTPSNVLWCLAHGQEPSVYGATCEEALVQMLQRFVRANERPIIGGVAWDDLKAEALRLLEKR